MHSPLVLNFDSAELRDALDHQCLRRLRRIGLKMPGLVFVRTENSRSLKRDMPILRNSDFTAPKNRARVQDGVAAFEIGMGEINLISAKHGKQASPVKVFRIHLPLAPTEDVQRIKLGIGGIRWGFLHQRLPEHCHAGHNNEHWPQIPKIYVDDSHFMELQKQANTNQYHSGRAPTRIRDLHNADNHEDHWPEVKRETAWHKSQFLK